jgi:hypothetical protein
MARYSTDRYSHPELHLALRHLRTRQGMTRPDVVARAHDQGQQLSKIYLAQCETDPQTARDPKSARQPSRDKLDIIVSALGSTMEDFEALLRERPWAPVVDAVRGHPVAHRDMREARAVSEGDEWDTTPVPLWERRRDELADLYDRASDAQRAELLAFARRLVN